MRLRQIALAARELEPVLDELHAVFGIEVGYRDPGVKMFGLHNGVIPVGDTSSRWCRRSPTTRRRCGTSTATAETVATW